MPIQVNLRPLKSDSIEKRASVFNWITYRGRYILLLMNIVLFGMYAYRFYLDRDNVLVKDDIDKLVVSISNLENNALTYSRLDEDAQFIVNKKDQNIDVNFVLNIVKENIPSNIVLKKISVNGRELVLEAESLDPESFSSYIGLLVSKERITSLILEKSSFDDQKKSYITELKLNYK